MMGILKSVAKKNNLRPVLEKILVSEDWIKATDLEVAVFIKNKDGISAGLYSKDAKEIESYNNNYNNIIDEYPNLNFDKKGTATEYNKKEFEKALNDVVFCAAKSQDNLSVNCVRFASDRFVATDTHRMMSSELSSNSEFSLPLGSAKILQKVLKVEKVEMIEVYHFENQVTFFIGDVVLKSRIIDLAFPDFKSIEDSFYAGNEIVLEWKVGEFTDVLKKILVIAGKREENKNAFELNFKEKKLKAKNENDSIEIDFGFQGDVNFDKIVLNAKFIEEYLKTLGKGDEIKLELIDYKNMVRINGIYYIMPFAVKEY